ncbi:zinc-ribbon domain-containing protein [Comamonas terrigena]|uniref:zinc-ribbon domain-containing protein n=1 Tax=Comamonas terrigena TaxID=32013 RepID=UPI0028ACA291|nr:zinc-ribbon domain-containing protein [Comamonas terrigena]
MSNYAPLLANSSDLATVLKVADADDLCVLADYITDNGEGRLSLDSDVNKKLSGCSKHKMFIQTDRNLIAQEILLFGGNTVANLYRSLFSSSSTITYLELVQDVAKKVSAPFAEGDALQDIEQAVLFRIFHQALEKMSDDERKRVLADMGISSFSSLRGLGVGAAAGSAVGAALAVAQLNVAGMVATAVSTQMIGRAVGSAAAFAGSRSAALLAGPIGLAVGALWTLADLSSPAYRVTLPCVVQVAYMRQKYLAALNSNKCPSCAAENAPRAKFCSECGKSLAKV